MKILIIAPVETKFKTGLSNAIKTTKDILEDEHDVYLIDTAVNINADNIRKFSIKRLITFFKIFFFFLIKIRKFDIVYITISMSLAGFLRDMIFIVFSKIFLKKIFLHLHGGGYKKNFFLKQHNLIKKIIIFTLKNCNKLFVLSESFRDDFNFIEEKKIKVLENTINVKMDKSNRNFDYLRIIYISNFIKSKGYYLILKTCKLLASQKINFKCEMYGKFLNISDEEKNLGIDQLKNEVKEFISSNKLDDKVTFSENLDSEKKYEKLKDANVFIFPSTYPGEGLPLSLIEALASKLPIISTNHGAIKDIVKHNYNGFILKTLNETEIANYLLQFTKNKELFKIMSENSLKIFNEKFSYIKIRDKTLNEFK